MTITKKEEERGAPSHQPQQRVQNRASPLRQVSPPTRKVKLGKWLASGTLILVLGGFWYYSHQVGGQPKGQRIASAPVRVAKVAQQDMPIIEHTIGTVVAYDTVQVTPQVPGLIQAIFFKEGQMVKKGDLLFQIDPRPFEAAVGQAKGQLVKDQAALTGATRDLSRYRSLMAVKAESQQVVDDQEATVDTDAGTVEADEASLRTAQINLQYAQIRSPVDGQTGPITIMPGNIISVTGTTTTVTPLVTITQIHPIKISFFLPQTDLPRIQARRKNGGLVATIDQNDAGGTSFTVPVDFVSNVVNNTTGTIELRATYNNADASLVPGQLVNVVVELSDIPKATVVPHDALAAGPDGQYVYKVVDGRAEQVAVNVLFDDSKNVAVQADLQPGDDVIVDGQLEVVPGAAVEVVKGAQAGVGGQNAGRGRRHGGGTKSRVKS